MRKHQQDDVMKTTLDLPNDLVREIKLRAAREGRKVKEVAADLLPAALAPSTETKSPPAASLAKTLPTIGATSAPSERAAVLSAQEFCEWVKEQSVAELGSMR
jgi:plasmid stability protein